MYKIKKGDKIIVTAGKDKGREGAVEAVVGDPRKVVVEGVNLYKKHLKGNQGQKGGIYDIPRPLDMGKVALICPSCKKPTRVGFKFAGEEKVRICKKCGKEIDVAK